MIFQLEIWIETPYSLKMWWINNFIYLIHPNIEGLFGAEVFSNDSNEGISATLNLYDGLHTTLSYSHAPIIASVLTKCWASNPFPLTKTLWEKLFQRKILFPSLLFRHWKILSCVTSSLPVDDAGPRQRKIITKTLTLTYLSPTSLFNLRRSPI